MSVLFDVIHVWAKSLDSTFVLLPETAVPEGGVGITLLYTCGWMDY